MRWHQGITPSVHGSRRREPQKQQHTNWNRKEQNANKKNEIERDLYKGSKWKRLETIRALCLCVDMRGSDKDAIKKNKDVTSIDSFVPIKDAVVKSGRLMRL
jgi:hypothetical protein